MQCSAFSLLDSYIVMSVKTWFSFNFLNVSNQCSMVVPLCPRSSTSLCNICLTGPRLRTQGEVWGGAGSSLEGGVRSSTRPHYLILGPKRHQGLELRSRQGPGTENSPRIVTRTKTSSRTGTETSPKTGTESTARTSTRNLRPGPKKAPGVQCPGVVVPV